MPAEGLAVPLVGRGETEASAEEVRRVDERDHADGERGGDGERARRVAARGPRAAPPTSQEIHGHEQAQDRHQEKAGELRNDGGRRGQGAGGQAPGVSCLPPPPIRVDGGGHEGGDGNIARDLLAVREQRGIEHREPERGQTADGAEHPPGPHGEQQREADREDHAPRPHGQAVALIRIEDDVFAIGGQAAQRVDGEDGHALAKGRNARPLGQEAVAVGEVVVLVVDEALVQAAGDEESGHDGEEDDRHRAPHGRSRGDGSGIGHQPAIVPDAPFSAWLWAAGPLCYDRLLRRAPRDASFRPA